MEPAIKKDEVPLVKKALILQSPQWVQQDSKALQEKAANRTANLSESVVFK